MKTSTIIVDNFYGNVDGVRNFALNQPFEVRGNYPGARTKTYVTEDVKNAIKGIVWSSGGNVTNWFEQDGLTGSFQIALATDRTWIHADNFNTWAGVCYLTPDAPHTAGTGLFRHKATGRVRTLGKDDKTVYEGYDYTKWDMYDRVGNLYNRLVLYRGDLFHASLDYFGDNLHNGRLFQVFFFDTEF